MKQRIGSILLALALCLSLLPTAAFADNEPTVAWINSTPYTTFDAAYNDAKDGDTIKLQADTGFSSANDIKKAITIQLNGHTFQCVNSWTTIKSRVTLEGGTAFRIIIEGTDANVTLKNMTLGNAFDDYFNLEKGATLTLENTTVSGTLMIGLSYPYDEAVSKLIVKSGSKINKLYLYNAKAQVSLAKGVTVGYISPADGGQPPADMLPSGCAFQDGNGNLIDHSSLYTDLKQSVTVVECPHTSWVADTGTCRYCNNACTEHTYNKAKADGLCTTCGHPCPHTESNDAGTCTLCGKAADKVQLTHGTDVSEYATFAAAYAAAAKGGTIKLLADVTADAMEVRGEAHNFTLDLNGHQLDGTLTVTGAVLTVQDSGSNGKVTGITATNGGSAKLSGGTVGTLTLKDGYIELSAKTAKADKLVVNGGHLAVTNGATIQDLVVNQTADLDLYYGIFQKITVADGLTIGSLLMDGYGFRSNTGVWYDQTSTATAITKKVVSQKLPIQSVTISGNTTVANGGSTTLTAEATRSTSFAEKPLTYQWYQVTDGDAAEIDNATDSSVTLDLAAYSAGTYTFRCAATCDGYTKTAEVNVTISPRSLTEEQIRASAPTANENLIYNGKLQSLVTASKQLDSAYVTRYKVGENGTWGTEMRATDAGTYTVYWKLVPIVEGNGPEYTSDTPISVSISPRPVTADDLTVTIGEKTYDGTVSATVTSVSWGDLPLRNGTDYTVSSAAFEDANYGTKAVSVMLGLKGNYTTANGQSVTVSATGSIAKADLTATPEGRLTVYNNQKRSYTFECSTLLPELDNSTRYGSISYYPDQTGTSIPAAYADAKQDLDLIYQSGKLTLNVNAVASDTEGKIGQIVVTVKSLNYNDFDMTVHVYAQNREKRQLTVTMEGWTYGQTPNAPQFDLHDGAGTPKILYSRGGSTTPTATVPTEAGSYVVAVQYDTATDTWVGEANFTIAKATPTGVPGYTAVSTSGKTLADAKLTTGTVSVAGTVQWVDQAGIPLSDDTEITANTAYTWQFTPDDSDNYTTCTGTVTLWQKSGSSSNTSSSTVKNPDGSTTTTTTNKKTGEVTETTKTPTGTVSTTVTDKKGNTETTVSVSKKDTQSGETIPLPLDKAKPADSKHADEITVKVPAGSTVTVEIPVKNPTPGTVVVIVGKDGTETVVPGSRVTENGIEVTLTEDATIKVIDNSKTFTDVPANAYFANAVNWAAARGITGGITATTFGPHQSCTRAQLVTFLWRAAGQPKATSVSGMTDVPADAYYNEAVAWAFENGIVGGYGNGIFGTGDTITRQQMAVILYRFAQATGLDTTQGGMAVREFSDYESIADYAVSAMQWAVNAGILQGNNGYLNPTAPCTRAQIVTMLYRLLGE